MPEREVSVTAAARGFSDLINRVRYRGESAILVKNGSKVARLSPFIPPPGAPAATAAQLAARLAARLPSTPPDPAERNRRSLRLGLMRDRMGRIAAG